jgi:hypothetical protein
MMEDFHGGLDLSRINYGMIVLIPKLKEVANIWQYKAIYLLNVFYKLFIFTKVLASRLMEVDGDVISENQTTFIQGRYILEGVVILHEVVHEIKVKKIGGGHSEITFLRKVMIRWTGIFEGSDAKEGVSFEMDWMGYQGCAGR